MWKNAFSQDFSPIDQLVVDRNVFQFLFRKFAHVRLSEHVSADVLIIFSTGKGQPSLPSVSPL
jgi:hypothetical protein